MKKQLDLTQSQDHKIRPHCCGKQSATRKLKCKRSRGKPAYREEQQGIVHHVKSPVWHSSCGMPLLLHTFYHEQLIKRGRTFAVRISHEEFTFSDCKEWMFLTRCPCCEIPLRFSHLLFSSPRRSDTHV